MEGAINFEVLNGIVNEMNADLGVIWPKLTMNEKQALYKQYLGCPLNNQDEFILENLGKVRVCP